MAEPSLLVIFGTRHRPDSCRRAVDSLLRYTTGVDLTIYVADARDRAGPRFLYDDDRVRVYEERPRLWMSGGMHRLLAIARWDFLAAGRPLWDWVCWLNDDIEAWSGAPDWAQRAIAALEAEPRAGMAALPYMTPHPPTGWHVNYWPGPPLLYANFGLLRRSVWEHVGGFDPAVPFYGCDNALALRVYGADLAILPVAGARLIHHYVEDTVRAANVREKGQEGWEPYRVAAIKNLLALQRIQARIGPPAGFELRDAAWIEPGADTYASVTGTSGR